MDLSRLIEWIKLSPKYLLPIGLVSGFLLFVNDSFLEKFGLKAFVGNFRAWIGIIFLMVATLIVIDISYQAFSCIKISYTNTRNRKKRIERLKNLTPEEKDILLGYLFPETRTQYFPINDGVVRGLEAESIIYQSSNVGDLDNWSFNIQPWAWQLLKKHFNEIFSEEEVNEFKASGASATKRSRQRAGYWY